ncbi:MAG: hypothetical protein EBS06_02450 [Proteobacteria bacterium]|nr:hypothetical protein [Pseudomonadota bacterium]
MTNNLAQTINLQQFASSPDISCWVFASAGSGKTRVLTNRVLRLLLRGVAPDKILCLTFTKVAASEMQSRINAELANWVLVDEANLAKKLFELTGNIASKADLKKARILFAEVLDAESKIKIQTIHSFCQSLVKIFPFEAGVKPNFEVLEEAQEKLLLQKAQKEVLKKAVKNSELKNLVVKINSRLHEASFSELVSDLLAKKEQLTILKENFFGIDGVIDEIFKNFSVNKNSNAAEICDEFFKSINKQEVDKLLIALEESGLISNKNIAEKVRKFLQNPSEEKFLIYQSAFFTDKNEIRKINGKVLQNPDLERIATDQINLISSFCDQINSYKICNSSALLLKFTDAILEIYAVLKKQNAFLDYNDLIIETNRLLANPNFSDWVKMKMDGLFDHILIDESQDTNHQQWNIIKALTEDFFSGISAANKNRTIFIVGDEKQSIYSFQGAEPHISGEIFFYFDEKLKNHPNKFHKIDLNNSFRSLSEILGVVDATFSGEKEKAAIAKISDFKGHSAIRQGVGHFEIWPQIKIKKEEKTKNADKDYSWKIDFVPRENYHEQEFLAELIAIKIKDWVENKRVLQSRIETLKYSDFMILLRKRTDGFDQILSRFFYQYQIPFGGKNKIKFDDNIIIQDLLAAARFALSPFDDLNLAALLKSPIFNINEEELLEICLFKNNNQTSIYKALKQIPKFANISIYLEVLEKKAVQTNCFEFFYFLLSQENRQKIISRFNSESSEILDKFVLKVFDFANNFSASLQKFLEFIESFNPEISVTTENNNQVLITTIHSAKGLQAPIVIIPDCCFDTDRLRSTKEKISWIEFAENKLPIWCAAKNEENKLLKTNRELKKQQAKDEYLRLLYVAMTRAEDELYIAGSGNFNDSESWYDLIKKSVADKCWQKEFFDEKTKKLNSDKFEISNEILGIGEKKYQYAENNLFINNSIVFDEKPQISFKTKEKKLNKSSVPLAKDDNIFTEIKSSQNQINQSQIKGKLIHKILEIFGKNSAAEKKWLGEISKKIIAREEFLSVVEKNKINDEINEFLASEQFKEIFSGQIKCEVEIAGNIKNEKFLKRIDLLIEKENEVLIVDYKSDETLPEAAPKHYFDQLKTYAELVKKLYPNKKISCAILWIKFLKLEFLNL